MENKIALGAGIGLTAGIVIGSLTDNISLWLSLGLCISAGVGLALNEKNKKQ